MFPDYSDPIAIMARTIYGEARGEGLLGQVSVAAVILNRVEASKLPKNKWWGTTICGVCLEKFQFSCWMKHDPNYSLVTRFYDPYLQEFKESTLIASLAVNGLLKDPTSGATHYCHIKHNPTWTENEVPTITIGNHKFYKLR